MAFALDDIALYHQIKTLISFWCRQGLNSRFLIQPSETLSVELIGTHLKYGSWVNAIINPEVQKYYRNV